MLSIHIWVWYHSLTQTQPEWQNTVKFTPFKKWHRNCKIKWPWFKMKITFKIIQLVLWSITVSHGNKYWFPLRQKVYLTKFSSYRTSKRWHTYKHTLRNIKYIHFIFYLTLFTCIISFYIIICYIICSVQAFSSKNTKIKWFLSLIIKKIQTQSKPMYWSSATKAMSLISGCVWLGELVENWWTQNVWAGPY